VHGESHIGVLPRGTVTFLLTDIEGSTRQWQENPESMKAAIERHDDLLSAVIHEHNGTVLKERGEGDSVFAVFARASDAVAAACSIQRSLKAETWPGHLTISVRIAIHTGEAQDESARDYRGTVVNRCARLRALAHGGQVLLSSTVRELTRDRLPTGVSLRDLGEHQLRDLDRPERVFQVVDAALAVERPARPIARLRPWQLAIGFAALLAAAATAVVIYFSIARGPATASIITTVAGTGIAGFSADGAKAVLTELDHPGAIAVDDAGNLYLVDANRVRKVAPDGLVSTVAGTGVAAYAGDGGPATLAQLNAPQGLAVGTNGDLFIADTVNNAVRKVDSRTGKISTIAGTGAPGFSGDLGPATAARLQSPTGVALGFGGQIFIADTLNNRIRRIGSDGTITTVAGTGQAGYAYDGVPAGTAPIKFPQSLAIDGVGNLYFVDAGNDRIRKVDLSGNMYTVAGTGDRGFSGNGLATSAKLNLAIGPLSAVGQALALDSQGNLYVADSGNNLLRKVALSGIISSVAGTGQPSSGKDGVPAASAALNQPLGAAVDSTGRLYIADTGNNRILIVR
jgi:class 3 adenylate cyclase/sugar lactone lactonase YvrE